MRMRHIVICGPPRSKIFFDIISERNDFSNKKKVTEHKMCVLIFSATFVWTISHSKKNWERNDKKCMLVFMYRCYSCQILIQLEFSRQIFEKSSNIRFNKNPPSGSRVVPCGRTDITEAKSLTKATVIQSNTTYYYC